MNNKTIIKVKNRGMFATLKNNAGILVVLLFLCILLTFLTDKFFTANNILSVLRQISINMYIAIGIINRSRRFSRRRTDFGKRNW